SPTADHDHPCNFAIFSTNAFRGPSYFFSPLYQRRKTQQPEETRPGRQSSVKILERTAILHLALVGLATRRLTKVSIWKGTTRSHNPTQAQSALFFDPSSPVNSASASVSLPS
ncbi:hypothetical protein PoMZ_13038, partial [Pyricularia oryzae]